MMKKQEVARYTSADRMMSKTNYETKKYKLKKEPKVEQASKFSTFPEAYAKNIEQFQTKKKKSPKNAEHIEQEEIEYLLSTIPFIKEYGKDTLVADEKENDDDDDDDAPELFNVKYTNTNKNTFNKYLYTVEKIVNNETVKSVLETETTDSLATCKCGGYLEHHIAEAALICNKCGEIQPYIESYSRAEDSEGGMAYNGSII
jgi:hypothetical protein